MYTNPFLSPPQSFTSYPAAPSSSKHSCPVLSSSSSPPPSGLPRGKPEADVRSRESLQHSPRNMEEMPWNETGSWGPRSSEHQNSTLSPACLFTSFYCRKSHFWSLHIGMSPTGHPSLSKAPLALPLAEPHWRGLCWGWKEPNPDRSLTLRLRTQWPRSFPQTPPCLLEASVHS